MVGDAVVTLRVAWILLLIAAVRVDADDELFLDPGTRYRDYFDNTNTTRIVEQDGALHFLVGGGYREETLRYVRSLEGDEVQLSSSRVSDDLGYDYVWDADGLVSIEIGPSWPQRKLRLTKFDPSGSSATPLFSRELEAVTEPSDLYTLFPVVERVGDVYLAAWLTGDELHLVRRGVDLSPIAATSFPLSHPVSFALEANGSRVLLAWPQTETAVDYLILDETGEPLFEDPIRTASSARITQIAATVSGEGWLLAFADPGGIDVLEISRDGVVTTVSRTLNADAILGLDIAQGLDGAVICWRDLYGWDSRVWGAPVDENLSLGDVTLVGTGDYVNKATMSGENSRQLDLYWTGEQFVCLWNEYHEGTAGPPCDFWSPFSQVVRARWFDADLDFAHEDPVELNRIYMPRKICRVGAGERPTFLMKDATSYAYQVVDADPMTGQCSLVREKVIVEDRRRCDTWFSPASARSVGETSLVAYTTSYDDFFSDTYGNTQVLARVHADGSWTNLVGTEHSSFTGRIAMDGDEVAAWMGVSFKEYSSEPDWCQLEYHSAEEDPPRRSWSITGESPQSLVIAGDQRGAKLVWWDERDEHRGLWHATVDPQQTASPITGEPLALGRFDRVRLLRLTRSDNQTLLVFVAGDSPEQLYWIRFDQDGSCLDDAPNFVGRAPDGGLDAIFHRSHYVIVWADDERMEALRIALDGELLDPTPVLVAETGASELNLSRERGAALGISYDGNRYRTFEDDLVPILLSGLTANWTPDGVVVSWTLHHSGFEGAELLRRVTGGELESISPILEPTKSGRMEFLDRIAERSRGYEYFVELHSNAGEMRFGPVVAETSGTNETGLSLSVFPNPALDTAVRIQFTVPSGDLPATFSILDPSGRRVHEEGLGNPGAGTHVIAWDPQASGTAAGVYFAQLRWNARTISRAFVLLRAR